jgi:hypothetical protein
MGYLRELLLGHVLTSMGRPADALAAYERAMAIVPGAQSARVATMNARLLRGDRPDAESMAEMVQSSPRTTFDPWWLYWQGDYRYYMQATAAARSMIR